MILVNDSLGPELYTLTRVNCPWWNGALCVFYLCLGWNLEEVVAMGRWGRPGKNKPQVKVKVENLGDHGDISSTFAIKNDSKFNLNHLNGRRSKSRVKKTLMNLG